MRQKSTGFLLTEALLAILILGLVSSSVFYMISASNRSTMDAYHQLLGEQLAQEVIEVFRSIGYNRLSECHDQNIGDYKLNDWHPITPLSKETGIERPAGCAMFERQISMQLLEKDGINAILLRVTVRPQKDGFKSDNEVSCSALLIEQP